MKTLETSIVVTFVVIAFICVGFAAALNQNEASAMAVGLPEAVGPGQTIQIRIFFTSQAADQLKINAVSVHFDWMPSGTFAGYHLPTPFTVPTGGGSYLSEQITITVPATATNGPHSYTLGIDGTQGATPFSWDSPTKTVDVVGGSTSTTTPTPTSSGGQPAAQQDLLMYGAIAAVAVVVVLLVVLVVLRRKRAKPKPEAEQAVEQRQPAPERKGPEQDFNI